MITDSALMKLSDTKNRHVLARMVCEIVIYRAVLCWVWRTPLFVIPNTQMLCLVFYTLSVAKRIRVGEHIF
jgi:hypothetical protein